MVIGIYCVTMQIAAFPVTSNTEGIQVYQKNLHLSPEHKQRLAAAINQYHNADNMWDLLRHEFTLPHYEDNPRVQEQIIWFLNNKDFLMRSATRAAPYLYFILQQVRKRHLPAELVLLPMIESAYNPFAYSSAGAAGLWQMMPNTATGFGIKQDWWYDGRRDVIASTRAALNYLSYLGNFFDGNWLLATAAYDTGEGNVLSAIKKNYRNNYRTDFWSLPVAQETQVYVPRLLALAVIISHPEWYPVNWPCVQNAPYLAQVDIGGQIDLKSAAYLSGLSLKKLMQLNPGYNRSATDPNGPFKLILPIENVQQFAENLERSPLYQNVNWMRYKSKHKESIIALSKRFKTSPNELRKMNPKLDSAVKAGQNLVIPKTSSHSNIMIGSRIDDQHKLHDVLEQFNANYTMQPGDTLYMVRKGDDLATIAKRFHTTAKMLAVINQLDSSKTLQVGGQLMIPTHDHSADNNAQPQNPYQLASGDTVYMVREGDRIENIAEKFHTTASEIRIVNLLTNNTLQEGDRLMIPTHKG